MYHVLALTHGIVLLQPQAEAQRSAKAMPKNKNHYHLYVFWPNTTGENYLLHKSSSLFTSVDSVLLIEGELLTKMESGKNMKLFFKIDALEEICQRLWNPSASVVKH